LRTVHADISGDLGQYGIKIPTATDGVAVAVGYEHRGEALKFAPDSGELGGLLSGAGSAAVAIDRQVSVSEEFAEIRVPIVQNMTGIKDLLVDTAFRRSDYENSGVTNTYKFELQYAPTSDVRFRSSINRAIRAPSIIELFNPQLVGLIAFDSDPCSPTVDDNNNIVPAAATAAQCAHTGVTASQYGNGSTTNTVPQGTGSQLSQLSGGNPVLKPETADTYTIGFTFSPTFAPGLTGSVDYYHIKITNLIGVPSITSALNDCLTTGNPDSCGLIVRNKQGGLNGTTIAGGGYFIQTNQNFSGASNANNFSGIDVQAA
jgi:outer membrane receptor protein involved in Fe transport